MSAELPPIFANVDGDVLEDWPPTPLTPELASEIIAKLDPVEVFALGPPEEGAVRFIVYFDGDVGHVVVFGTFGWIHAKDFEISSIDEMPILCEGIIEATDGDFREVALP